MGAAGRTWIRTSCLLALVCLAQPLAAPGDEPEAWTGVLHVEPFVCRANFDLQSVEPLLHELRQLQADLSQTLGLPPSRVPIELYLFRDRETYDSYLRKRFPSVPSRRALFVKSGGQGMVYAYLNREFEIDLRHETTHALLHAVLPDVPLWLDEGLAEYFEAPPAERAFDSPHLTSVRLGTHFRYVPRLTTLELWHELDEMGRREYRAAWAWGHFMLHGSPEAHDELVRYLSDLRTGIPTAPLTQRLTQRQPDVEHRFVHHFQHWRR